MIIDFHSRREIHPTPLTDAQLAGIQSVIDEVDAIHE